MTGDISRPSEWRTLGNHERRIQILEALDTCCNPLIVNPGDIEIDPEFAECINLIAGHVDFSSFGSVQPGGGLTPIPGTRMPIGSHKCNYDAGFRLQVNAGISGLSDISGIGFNILGPSPTFAIIGGGGDTDFPPAAVWPSGGGYSTGGEYVTGWMNESTGSVGVSGDLNYVELVATTNLGFSTGGTGPGSMVFKWVAAGTEGIAGVPSPTASGQMLYSPDGIVWNLLAPGTAGQVLTMSGGFPTWV